MIFECESIEERDESGAMEATGVNWLEARTLCEAALQKLAFGFGYVGLAGIVYGLLLGPVFKWPIVLVFPGIVSLALVCPVAWLSWRIPGRARELTFWTNGIGYAPLGLSTWPLAHDRLKRAHTDIASIEAEQLVFPKGDKNPPPTYTHGVRMFMRSGEVVHVAQYLEPDDAHMLAVRLTQALMALRENMAANGASVAGSGTTEGIIKRKEKKLVD